MDSEEPLRLRGITDRDKRRQMVADMLVDVGLDPSFADREAEGLSGGPETENQHWNSAFDGFQADHCGRAGIGPGCHGSVSDFKADSEAP